MSRPLLPPKYHNVPIDLTFDKKISPAVRDTYCQLNAMAWADKGKFLVTRLETVIELTGKKRSTIYGHLTILVARGWLLFSSDHHSGLTITFLNGGDAVHDAEGDLSCELSRNLDLLIKEEEVKHLNTPLDSDQEDIKPPPDIHGFNPRGTVQKSGQMIGGDGELSRNQDKHNGWHDVIDDELADYIRLEVGLFDEKLPELAEYARKLKWTPDEIRAVAEQAVVDKGRGAGYGLFLYRIRNGKKPRAAVDDRRKYIEGKYGSYVER